MRAEQRLRDSEVSRRAFLFNSSKIVGTLRRLAISEDEGVDAGVGESQGLARARASLSRQTWQGQAEEYSGFKAQGR